jgi:hypothetical protein
MPRKARCRTRPRALGWNEHFASTTRKPNIFTQPLMLFRRPRSYDVDHQAIDWVDLSIRHDSTPRVQLTRPLPRVEKNQRSKITRVLNH